MTAREDLADIIHGPCDGSCPPGTQRRIEDMQIADAIIAAGWIPPDEAKQLHRAEGVVAAIRALHTHPDQLHRRPFDRRYCATCAAIAKVYGPTLAEAEAEWNRRDGRP